MPRLIVCAVLTALPLVAYGCGDPAGPTEDELIGVWIALEYEYTSQADTTRSIDLVQEAGATYTIELITGGSYRWRLNTPTGGTLRGTGTYDVDGDRLRLTPADGGDVVVYSLRFNGIYMRLSREDAEYDFDGDGTAEPADFRLLLDRS